MPRGSEQALEDLGFAANVELRRGLVQQHHARAELNPAQYARQRDAPNTRAASSVLGSKPSQSPPTVRTTTAWLKKAWASRIAGFAMSPPQLPE